MNSLHDNVGGVNNDDSHDKDDDGTNRRPISLKMDESGNVTTVLAKNRVKQLLQDPWTNDDEGIDDDDDEEDQQQQQPQPQMLDGGEEETEEFRGGPDSPSSATTSPARSISPRSWTNRSKPSPKREKLIRSLRGKSRARSPLSETTASTTTAAVATTSRSPTNDSASQGGLAELSQHLPDVLSTPTTTPPREFVQSKPSIPTDEDTENEIHTHATSETNEQAYMSAEDHFSDETRNHDDDEEVEEDESTSSSSTDGHSSEWDVAVKKGKATIIGQAAKDFFATLQPVFSGTIVAPPELHRQHLPHPSFNTTTDDEENDEREDGLIRHQLTTPTHSNRSVTTSSGDDDDEFSTPMTTHYVGNNSNSRVQSYSENDGATEDEEEAERSNSNGRPSASYSREEGYEDSSEENEDLDDEEEDLDDDDEEGEEDGYDDEQITTPRARTMRSRVTSPTRQQRAKGSVVVRVQFTKSTDASLETREPESHQPTRHFNEEELSAGILPEVFINMRQKIEALSMFDSDILKYTANSTDEAREALKRSSQQSISAAILVTLTHKRYERRRLASIHIEQVVRSLITEHIEQSKQQRQTLHSKSYVISRELERVRAILLLLSEDYVRSTNEDARKGGKDVWPLHVLIS
jgi:hypothetical protein